MPISATRSSGRREPSRASSACTSSSSAGASAGLKADGLRRAAREWKPLTSTLRRTVDGVLPGSGAFATPARIAAGLARPQAEDLRARLERAGFPVLIQPKEREIPAAPQ